MKEFEILKSIYAASKSLGGHVTIGPGDDMGEISFNSHRLLCAVDQLIVGRHVTPETQPHAIGRKAIARCFSDIAAMAGTPTACLMTACLPQDTDEVWALAVFEGARRAAEQWGGPIVGGDIATQTEASAVFSVTALAVPPPEGAVRRTGSVIGDVICVTGELGLAGKDHHLTFSPRISEAQSILQELHEDLHAMIDISDGLGQDASHLASEQLQLMIQTASIPLRQNASIANALSDGEDYELLFTSSRIPTHPFVTVIGEVVARTQHEPAVVDEHGNDLSKMGWEHS